MLTGKDARRCNAASNILSGVFTHRVEPVDKHHTTGKPAPLMRDLVRICEPGGRILDPLAGSGSTGVAALELGYEFLGCELLPEYAAIAMERLDQADTDDGLARSWRDHGLVYCFPPPGQIPEWAAKIAREARAGAEIVVLGGQVHNPDAWTQGIDKLAPRTEIQVSESHPSLGSRTCTT